MGTIIEKLRLVSEIVVQACHFGEHAFGLRGANLWISPMLREWLGNVPDHLALTGGKTVGMRASSSVKTARKFPTNKLCRHLSHVCLHFILLSLIFRIACAHARVLFSFLPFLQILNEDGPFWSRAGRRHFLKCSIFLKLFHETLLEQIIALGCYHNKQLYDKEQFNTMRKLQLVVDNCFSRNFPLEVL